MPICYNFLCFNANELFTVLQFSVFNKDGEIPLVCFVLTFVEDIDDYSAVRNSIYKVHKNC